LSLLRCLLWSSSAARSSVRDHSYRATPMVMATADRWTAGHRNHSDPMDRQPRPTPAWDECWSFWYFRSWLWFTCPSASANRFR
jgi:hypothetical protein